MKFYESKETTPLFFYKFYRNIYIPLLVIVSLYDLLILIFSQIDKAFDWRNVFSCTVDLFSIVIGIIILIGLIRWKRYVVNLVCAIFVCSIVTFIFGIVNLINKQYLLRAVIIIGFLGLFSRFLNFLIYVYFYKRKNLLDSVPYKITEQNMKIRKPLREYFAEDNLENSEITDDRERCVCGYPVLYPEYTACPDCGREYIR